MFSGNSKLPAITLPPPMNHREAPPTTWQGGGNQQQPNPPASNKATDIAVLGADIIAETFGELVKKAKIPSSEPISKLLSPQETPTTPDGPRGPHEQFSGGPLSRSGEWNPRLGPPPSRMPGRDYNWPENRPPPPTGDFNRPSPFSWQRSDHFGDFPPQNPFVYRRPENEPQRDPRLSAGDPRRAAQAPPLMRGPPPGPHHDHPPGEGEEFHHDRAPPIPSLMGDQRPRYNFYH